MENKIKNNLDIIQEMIEKQLNEPGEIRMADSTTFAYRFLLNPAEAVSLGLPPMTPQADITLDLMMEFMNVIGYDAAGNETAKGAYPDEAKRFFIPRIFDLYGKKIKSAPRKETPDNGEQTLTGYLKSESLKQVRRFYLNYPAKNKKGETLHLFIETEVDEEDASYLNYWVGCEEYTAKRYIASCQADLEQENPLDVVKVKHLYFYINEIQNSNTPLQATEYQACSTAEQRGI